MFQRKIDKLFNYISNGIGIADDILIAGFDADGKDDVSLEKLLWRWRQANLKLKKEKCLFRYTCVSFFREVILRHGVSPDLAKIKTLTDLPPPKQKRTAVIPGYSKLPKQVSPMTAEVCKTFTWLTSVNTAWMWNRSYQEMYERAKSLVKEDICMKCYNVRVSLYLETDASVVGLCTTYLQLRDNQACSYDKVPDNAMLWPTAFACKSLSSAEQCYSNI